MVVGSLQIDVKKKDKESNLEKIGKMIDKPVDIVVLPELFSTGYFYETKSELLEIAEEIPGGYTTNYLCEIAKKNNCHLIGAIVETQNSNLYITAVIVGPEGYIGKQRKRHLTKHELNFFTCGESSDVFDIKGCKVGVIICFEGWFPESSRELAIKGAQIICHSLLTCQQRTLDIIRVRAIENKTFFVVSNSISTEIFNNKSVTYRGDSRVIDFEGDILVNAEKNEGLICVEINEKATIHKDLQDCDDLLFEISKIHR